MTAPRWFVEAWEIPGASPFQRRVMDVPGVLEFTQPASGVGRANLTIPKDWGRLDEILDPDNDVGSLLRVIQTDRSGDPQIRAEYLLRRTETPRKDAGNLVTLTSPSIEDALEWAVVYPHDWPTIPSVDPNWTWGFESLLSTQNQGFEENPYSLINPGAEDGTTNGWPTTGTRAEQIAPETFEAIEDAGDADDGDWYFSIIADTGEGVFQDFTKPLVEGETYIVSCRLFVATGETTRMEVTPAASVSVGSLFNGAAFADAVGNDAYQTVTVTFVADAGAGGISVLSQTDGNTFRLDKVRVEGFGVGTDDWSIRGTVDVFAVVPSTTVPAPPVHTGTFSLAWHPNSGTAGNDSLFLSQPTVPGQEVTGEIWVYHTEGVNEDFRIVLRIPGVNPNTQNVASEVFSVPTATWTLLTATGIATTTTTELELRYDETGAPASNIYVDDADFYTGQAPATIGDMMLQLLADAQTDHSGEVGDLARATLLWLKADFDASLDSAGNAWRASESLTIVRGKTYGKVLSDDFAKLGYEYRIKPNPSYPGDSESHILQIFNPADLTTRVGGASNDLVGSVGFSGGSVVKGPVVKTPKSRTVALAEGDAQLFAVAKDAPGVAAWGARELYLAERDVLEAATLAQVAATALVERGAAIEATRITIVDDDVFSPYLDFVPGDWVRGELPPDLPRGNHRIVAVTGIIREGNTTFDLDIGAHVFVGASGMHEAVSRLLSKFDGIDAPVEAASAAAILSDAFTGPIEPGYLVAAVDTKAVTRKLADFRCNGTNDEVEILAAALATYVTGSDNGGVLRLAAGDFGCDDEILITDAKDHIALVGAGVSATLVSTSTVPASDVDGFIVNLSPQSAISDMRVVVLGAGYLSAVKAGAALGFGLIERVHAYVDSSGAEASLIGTFWVTNDMTVRDVFVEASAEGTGIYVDGDRVTVADSKVHTATAQGALDGDGIFVDGDDCRIVGNSIGTGAGSSIAGAGIRIAGNNCVVIGNTCPDGILIDASANGTILGGNVGTVTNLGTGTRIFDETGFFNGSIIETFSATVTEAAGTVTMSLEKDGGGELTMWFSDGRTRLDTDPALTIALTTGDDDAPTTNYIYILQSDKILTKSTSGFPTATEHIKVAFFLVPSATFVSANGLYVQQNWTDHASDDSGQGHLLDISERLRRSQALYFSGLAGAGADDYLTIVGGTVDLKIASGLVYQMHLHAVPAFDTSGGDIVLVKNWSGDAFHDITNLFDIVDLSDGTAIGNNKFFNLVVWGVANQDGTFAPTIINLPSGQYTSQASAEADLSGFDDFTIPREFLNESSTGFLICRLTIQHKNTTWEYKSTTDLRGTSPQTASGGAAGVTTTFLDNQFEVVNVDDVTKILQLDVSSVTTGNTRTLVVPDGDGTIALESYVDTADALKLDLAGGTMAGTIDMDGNTISAANAIGINVTPTVALHVVGTAGGNTAIFDSNTGLANVYKVGGGQIGAIGSGNALVDGGSAADLAIRAEGDLVLAVSNKKRVVIDAADHTFFKQDGSTPWLTWDESDNRPKFATDVDFESNDLLAVNLVGYDPLTSFPTGTEGDTVVVDGELWRYRADSWRGITGRVWEQTGDATWFDDRVAFNGASGNRVSTADENLLDCDSSWFAQGTGGLWTVGTPSTEQAIGLSPRSLKVTGGASTAITPVDDAAAFGLKIYSAAGDTFDINGGGVVVPAGVWTELTEAGPDGTYTVGAAGAGDYYIAEVMLGASSTFVPSVRIVGDVDLRAKATVTDVSDNFNTLLATRSGNDGFQMDINASTIHVRHGTGSNGREASSADPGFADGVTFTVRAACDVSAGEWEYFFNGVSFETDTGLVTGAASPKNELRVGAQPAGFELEGSLEWAEVRDGIGDDAPVVARFDARDVGSVGTDAWTRSNAPHTHDIRFATALRIENHLDLALGVPLGGGAAATLATIGGGGPGTAAQSQWVEIKVDEVVHWIPAWL